MTNHYLLTALRERNLLCDGGMGTQLMIRGLTQGECGERWNVERPGDVEAVHRAYRKAGCDLITTNTFGGSRASLDRHMLGSRVEELNRAGAAVARKAGGDEAFVLGDIGPLGVFLEPLGDLTVEQAQDMFIEQALALAAGGADALIVETMSDPGELSAAVRSAVASTKKPVIATYAFQSPDGKTFNTMMGTAVRDAVSAAVEAGASIVGANCGTDLSLDAYLRLTEQLVQAAGAIPVIVQPNAGKPELVGGRTQYPASPGDMAGYVPRFLSAGARIIGGCCGTTPAHLAAMSQALRSAAR